jgi:antitoxin (DNA-binding transcriptional repressor) of toxin-antitoxin stability system
MKTISLRTLVREPLKVKRMTRAGLPVQVTDNGQPLWLIQPVATGEDDHRRRREIEAELAVVLSEARSGPPLSAIILESRR